MDKFIVVPEQSVGRVASVCQRTTNFELNDLRAAYVASCFVLKLSIGQVRRSRS